MTGRELDSLFLAAKPPRTARTIQTKLGAIKERTFYVRHEWFLFRITVDYVPLAR